MSNVPQFLALLEKRASFVTFHRESGGTACPCLTPEGYRNPLWHEENSGADVCNENGRLDPVITEIATKAFVQPIQSTRATRLSTEHITQLFGEVELDDHLGIFAWKWDGQLLDFQDWSQSGEDYIFYLGKRFLVINTNVMSDPSDGQPHHVEVGLRLIKNPRPT